MLPSGQKKCVAELLIQSNLFAEVLVDFMSSKYTVHCFLLVQREKMKFKIELIQFCGTFEVCSRNLGC